jgi:hypothetical protein
LSPFFYKVFSCLFIACCCISGHYRARGRVGRV